MKKRILIIDADSHLNRINEKILVSSGIVNELHIALNGKEALDYLMLRIEKQYPLPEIIILDLHMPVMNGFEFLDEYQKLEFAAKHKIEIIVFTASNNPKDKQRVYSRGIKNYLYKPYLMRGLNGILYNQ